MFNMAREFDDISNLFEGYLVKTPHAYKIKPYTNISFFKRVCNKTESNFDAFMFFMYD